MQSLKENIIYDTLYIIKNLLSILHYILMATVFYLKKLQL